MRNLSIRLIPLILTLVLAIEVQGQIQTLTLRPGPLDGKGAELTTYYPTRPGGDSPSFDANAWTVGGEPVTVRSLLAFDLTGIPQQATVLSAKLSLFCNPASGHYQLQSGDNQSYLLRIIEPWDGTASWNTQPEVSFDNPVWLPTSTTNTQNYPDIDVTDHVQDMVSDPAHNYGWEIRLLTEVLYRSMVFSSCMDEAQYRPILTVQYKTCTPPEARWGYVIQEPLVRFADSSGSGTYAWWWDFGDGYSSSLRNPVHTYGAYGKYPVCHIVTDSCDSDTICDTVFYCPPLNASFNQNVSGLQVTFTVASPNAIRWFWSFGDGFYSDLKDPVHVFNQSGKYKVCLTVSDNCLSETYCDSVLVVASGIGDAGTVPFSLHPVPARDILWINFSPGLTGEGEVRVVELTGSRVLVRPLSLPVAGNKLELDVSALAQGSYVLHLVMDNKVVVGKFVIMR